MVWSGVTAPPNPWARVHIDPASTDGGVDFEMRIQTEFPIKTTSSPHGFTSGLTTGNP